MHWDLLGRVGLAGAGHMGSGLGGTGLGDRRLAGEIGAMAADQDIGLMGGIAVVGHN